MRSRFGIRKIPSLRSLPLVTSLRLFTYNTLSQSRPQLLFLATPTPRPVTRFFTTERKRWIKDEARRAGKYTAVIWTSTFLLLVLAFGVQQEWLERKFPSPHEWSWATRKNFRSARWDEDHDDDGALVDWARTGEAYRRLLERLEDPNIDGADLQDQAEGGILVAGVGKTGFDISRKPEPWRRGYYEVLMGAARAAEHLDGWVRDKTRHIAFPRSVVIGPSNPSPRPVPPGAAVAPREEDCEPAFDAPETYYMRILTTKGFTEKQRVDAALAYAAWLGFKGTPGAACEMYKWALDIATPLSAKPYLESAGGVLDVKAGLPSENLLSATAALATHHALDNNLLVALPIFVSALRARRSLPEPPTTMLSTLNSDEADSGMLKTIMSYLLSAIVQGKYPSPPSDGTAPPSRTSKERCEEAGLMAHIGEILYVSKSSSNAREDGLAWTRDGVDIAEQELRRKGIDQDTRKTCKQCLETGLSNWATMVSKLAREEKDTRQNASDARGWLGFKSQVKTDFVGRWESEEKVVKDRLQRAKDVLGPSPTDGNSSFLTV